MSRTIRSARTSQSKRMAHESWLSQSHEAYVKDKPRQTPKKSTTVIPLLIVKLSENGTDDSEDGQ